MTLPDKREVVLGPLGLPADLFTRYKSSDLSGINKFFFFFYNIYIAKKKEEKTVAPFFAILRN